MINWEVIGGGYIGKRDGKRYLIQWDTGYKDHPIEVIESPQEATELREALLIGRFSNLAEAKEAAEAC